MYGTATTSGASTGAALAVTGMNIGWAILAVVTLIVVGGALLRLVPRKES